MADPYPVISSDSHVMEPPDLWSVRLDREYRDRGPRVVSEDQGDWWYFGDERAVPCLVTANVGSRFGGTGLNRTARAADVRAGALDPDERLKDLALDGIFGEVLYPTVGMFAFRWVPDGPLVDAMCRAYNDWLGEFCAAHPERFKGAAMLNVDDVGVAVTEVQRAATKGFVSALIPVDPGEGRAYSDSDYDPLWAALQDAGMHVAFHTTTQRERKQSRVGQFAVSLGPSDVATDFRWVQKTLADLILSGVFERFPRLHGISVEFEGAWAPSFLEFMDLKYKFYTSGTRNSQWTTFKDDALPSDFFRQNVAISVQEDRLAVSQASAADFESLMWGSDYPHTSGTFPKSREIIENLVSGLSERDRTRFVYSNAANLFGFKQ